MRSLLENTFVIAVATLMLSACGSGSGGGTSAATPTANGAGFVGGLAVGTNTVGQVPINTWTGVLPMPGNAQLFNVLLSQSGQCQPGFCGPTIQGQFLQVTISTLPSSGCPNAAPGTLPGPVYFSVTTVGGIYGSNGLTQCGAGFLTAQGTLAINYPAQIGGAYTPTLQINTQRTDANNMRAQIFINGQPFAAGLLRGSGGFGGAYQGGGYQGAAGYQGGGVNISGGVYNPAFAAAVGSRSRYGY